MGKRGSTWWFSATLTRTGDRPTNVYAFAVDWAEREELDDGVRTTIANAADDLKDRVDNNPASRPGPDPTDRPERRE